MNVITLSLEDRLNETFKKTLPLLGPQARMELEAMLTKESLGVIAAVITAWVVSHAFGFGEIIDIVIMVVGAIAIGWAVFTGIDHLYEFAVDVYRAKSANDLDRAATHLAQAIVLLGIQTVLAILFKGGKAYRPSRGGRFNIGPAPRIGERAIRYKPTITKQANLPAGEGWTSWWGDITVSTRGSIEEQNLVSLHEYVHSFLSPKFSILRNYRASNRATSYVNSSLYRYIEEALAETISQVGIKGWGNFFEGIKFPVQNGYMHLTKGGSLINSRFTGSGLLPEAAVLISQGIALGFNYHLYFELNSPPVFNAGAM